MNQGLNTANTRIIRSNEKGSSYNQVPRNKSAAWNLNKRPSNENGRKPMNFMQQNQKANSNASVLGEQRMAIDDGFYGGSQPMGLPESPSMINIRQGSGPYTIRFDLKKKTPLYAAYSVTAANIKKIGLFKNKRKWTQVEKLGTTDAYDDYYEDLGKNCIQKGHLNPAKINSYDQDKVDETFTYANAVPQYAAFNGGRWKVGENAMVNFAKDCSREHGGAVYFLTGVSQQHFGTNINFQYPDSANLLIPRSMWTAACCVWKENNVNNAKSVALLGNNVPNKEQMNLQQLPVSKLEKLLAKQPAQLFPGSNNLCGESRSKVQLNL